MERAQRPGCGLDLPTKYGPAQPLVAVKWIANSPLRMVDPYVPNLKQYCAIALDVGTQDPFPTTNTQLHDAPSRLGVENHFESYDGVQGKRIRARFAEKVPPFFSRNLAAQE